eukprot:scaffold187601_cov30-Prasinocladus_malaysianus.AAC.1
MALARSWAFRSSEYARAKRIESKEGGSMLRWLYEAQTSYQGPPNNARHCIAMVEIILQFPVRRLRDF